VDLAPQCAIHGNGARRGVTRPVLRVAVIGAECTGKTWLCNALAERHGGLWVPEELREFVARTGRGPQVHEQVDVMREQVKRETEALARAARTASPLVAFDSAPLATALYSRMYFGDDSLLSEAVRHHHARYDATLLADVDLAWEPDGLQRDGPELRARFHALLVGCLAEHRIAHTLIQGVGENRLAAAQRALSLIAAT
jgi:nicotinamide riboside kinase